MSQRNLFDALNFSNSAHNLQELDGSFHLNEEDDARLSWGSFDKRQDWDDLEPALSVGEKSPFRLFSSPQTSPLRKPVSPEVSPVKKPLSSPKPLVVHGIEMWTSFACDQAGELRRVGQSYFMFDKGLNKYLEIDGGAVGGTHHKAKKTRTATLKNENKRVKRKLDLDDESYDDASALKRPRK